MSEYNTAEEGQDIKSSGDMVVSGRRGNSQAGMS